MAFILHIRNPREERKHSQTTLHSFIIFVDLKVASSNHESKTPFPYYQCINSFLMNSGKFQLMAMHRLFQMMCILWSIETFSQSIITDRPDQTESAVSILPGALQMETGLAYSINDSESESLRTIHGPTTLLRIGLVDRLEFRIQQQLLHVKGANNETVSGFADTELGMKYQLSNPQTDGLSWALLTHVVIPTGSTAFSNPQTTGNLRLCAGVPLNPQTSLSGNLAYFYAGSDPNYLAFSLSFARSVGNRAGFFIEPYGSYADDKVFESYMDAGITYLWNSNLQLDFSFGVGMNVSHNFISFGLAWRCGYSAEN